MFFVAILGAVLGGSTSCDFTGLINQQINDELTASQFYFQQSYKFRHANQTR